MKLIILFAFSSLILFSKSSFAQTVIRASDAYKHIGERVLVKDSVYYGKVYNDSTATFDLGSRRMQTPLTVLCSAGRNKQMADPNFIASYLQKGRIRVYGLVLLIKSHPTIILTDWKDLQLGLPHSDTIDNGEVSSKVQ